MTQERHFKVCAVGVPQTETSILSRVLRISGGRNRTYELVEDGTKETVDFVLAHVDSRESEQLRDIIYKFPNKPVVLMGAKGQGEGRTYFIETPIVASRLLKVFDQITVQELKFAPELKIGAEDQASQEAVAKISSEGDSTKATKFNPRASRALVVDDSAPVRKQLEVGLRMLGVDADFAEDGDQALLKLSQAKFDIIFLDVVMPGKDGFAVCKLIKKNPTTKDVPVVMLTGKSSAMDKVKGSLAGCQAYLTKPIDSKEFQTTLEKFIKEK